MTDFSTNDWGLFCGELGRQIIRVGTEACGPVSSRKVMADPNLRRLLLDEGRIAQVYESKTPLRELVELDGSEWTIEVRPIFSPRSSTLIGVHAGVFSVGRVPDPPAVGAWEWEIACDDSGLPTSQRTTYWDVGMYLIYELFPLPGDAQSRSHSVGEWVNTLVDKTDQMRLSSSVRDGIDDAMAGRQSCFRCLTYHIVTGHTTESPGAKHVRLVGRMKTPQPEDGVILLQGFTYEVSADFHDLALEQDAARVDDVLRGVLELSDDPVAVVDTRSDTILMTSPAWCALPFGQATGLSDVPFLDADEVHDFVNEAARSNDTVQRRNVQLFDGKANLREHELRALRVQSSSDRYDVVIRLCDRDDMRV